MRSILASVKLYVVAFAYLSFYEVNHKENTQLYSILNHFPLDSLVFAYSLLCLYISL